MSFQNVSVIKKANVYHDGKVTSRTVFTSTGAKMTLGVMLSGKYTFTTKEAERIEVTQGHCIVKVDGQSGRKEYKAGEDFHIPANSSFEIEILQLVDYVCHFEK